MVGSPRETREEKPGANVPRLAGIEGIRAIAATSVLVYHVYLNGAPDARPVDLGVATKPVENLRAGVTLFFVLSGFLLYRVFVAAALRGLPMPSVREYLRNRALRFCPRTWSFSSGSLFVFQPELVTMPLMLLANMLLLQNYVPSYSLGGDEGLGIVPAWSLVVEVSFYLLLPVLGYVALRLAAPRRYEVAAVLVPVGAMLGVGIAAKVIARTMEPSGVMTVWSYSLPLYADWFAAGMAVAVVRVLYEDGRLAIRRAWVGAGALVALVLAALSAKLHYQGVLIGNERQTANAVLFALALILVVTLSPQAKVVRLLSLWPVIFLGLASYSLFLLHDPIVRGCQEWGLTRAGASGCVANLALLGSVSVLLASATYLFVERPALTRKRAWQGGERAGLGSSAPTAAAEPASSTVPLADALAQAMEEASWPERVSVDVVLGGAEDVLVRRDSSSRSWRPSSRMPSLMGERR